MRLSIALLTFNAVLAGSTHAHAGGLCDWLHGRTPYAVGYPVYSAGYVAAYPGTYAAAYQAATQATYSANYPVASTSLLPPSTAPAITGGAYQAQRPGYYDNPSVYTGQPVTGGLQSSNRVPLASAYRGSPVSSYYGGGVQSPPSSAFATGSYAANYPAPGVGSTGPGLPLTVTTPSGAPVSALPATQVAPLFAPTPPRRSGLGRFFGSWFGTDYRSSYNRAPVTYYRPVTTVDPVSGTTITVQQPCTSYEQYVQRSPYNSLQLAPPASPASGACPTPMYGGGYSVAPANPYGASPIGTNPYGTAAGGVAPATALGSGDQMTIPIPSLSPGYGPGVGSSTTQSAGPGNLAPLSGTPPGLSSVPGGSYQRTTPSPYSGPGPSSGSSSDRTPVDPPSLPNSSSKAPAGSYWDESPQNDDSDESSSPADESYWSMPDPRDSTAMVAPSRQAVTAVDDDANPFELGRERGPSVEPIAAPDGYVSPYRRTQEPRSDWRAPSKGPFEAPPLPTRSKIDQVDYTQLPRLPRGQVHEVKMVRNQHSTMTRVPVTRPAPIRRDTNWLPVGGARP